MGHPLILGGSGSIEFKEKAFDVVVSGSNTAPSLGPPLSARALGLKVASQVLR